MPITAIIAATNCRDKEVSEALSKKLGYDLITDKTIFDAAQKKGASREKLRSAVYGDVTRFNKSDIERRLNIALFKRELLREIAKDDKVFSGFGALLLPPSITHVLKVCLIGSQKYRQNNLMNEAGIDEKEAINKLKNDDSVLLNWTQYLFDKNPSDPELYDIVFPMDGVEPAAAAEEIYSNASRSLLTPTPESIAALKDEMIAANAAIALLEKKHDVDVEVEDGVVKILIKKFVLFMEKYKKELKALAEKIDGVSSVEVGISKAFKTPSIAAPVDIDIPQKILLVDDEIEFVQTLSERLKTRNFDSSVAFNGEEALERFDQDPPEVMILDLKMPGINGLEVLEKVKQKNPETEVIILTGHGSDRERQAAFELGAFDYLEKPADINVLSETMLKAYEKINKRKEK